MSSAATPRVLCALSESAHLARAVGQLAGLETIGIEERVFEGGEFKLRPLGSLRGRSVFILQCLAGSAQCSVSERLLRLLFLAHGLGDAGAERRIALLPYLSFARKDRRTQPRDPVNSRYVAQLLESAGIAQVITLDVHNPAALDNSFRIPLDHLTALPLMVDHLVPLVSTEPVMVMSPDVGGIKRAQLLRELLQVRLEREIELGFLEKRRALGVLSGGSVVGDVRGRTVLLIDDLCASGETLSRAAAACTRGGAKLTHALFTHAPQPQGVTRLLGDANIASVVTTDSVGLVSAAARLVVLPIAPLFGCAVRRILAGKPLVPLLSKWPVEPDA